MTPTFSVIIPAYNAETFLERAVRSAQNQTFPPREILVIDDCSTDGTYNKVADLAKEDPRIRLLQTPQNGGPSAARNLGFDNATGDWIAVLDADDAFAPNRLKEFSKTIAHSSADILADDLLYYDAGASCVTGPANATQDFNGKSITLKDFLKHNVVDGKSMDWGLLKPVFRREFLTKTGLRYRTDMRHGEDFYFIISLFLNDAQFILIDQALYLYTQRSGAISKKLSDLTRTSIAYGTLASSALSLAQQAGIESHPELTDLLIKRACGLMRLDDAHFFSVAVRRRDLKGLFIRAVKRPVFMKQVFISLILASRRRLQHPFSPKETIYSFKKNLYLWKNIVKCLFYGFSARNKSALEFQGWSDTIITNAQPQSESTIPKIIWLFWDGTTKPPLVQATIARIHSLNPDYQVHLLDKKNVSQFIDCDFLDRSDITVSHKSDLIRLELLAQHGGIWVDATCIFNEDFKWVDEASQSVSADLIAFYRAQDTHNYDFPIIESWFLASSQGNRLIRAWRDEFRKILNNGSKSYFLSVSQRNDYTEIRQGIERPEYLIVYLSEQIAIRRIEKPRLFLRKAEDSPFLYQQLVKWNRERIGTILCRLQAPTLVPPVIKLTHSNRYLLPFLIRHGLVRSNSILGEFLNRENRIITGRQS